MSFRKYPSFKVLRKHNILKTQTKIRVIALIPAPFFKEEALHFNSWLQIHLLVCIL